MFTPWREIADAHISDPFVFYLYFVSHHRITADRVHDSCILAEDEKLCAKQTILGLGFVAEHVINYFFLLHFLYF